MRTRVAVLAILCAVLVGCDAAATPSASPAAASSAPAIALASPSPAAPAVATPKPTPRPTPKPTPVPVPPKPTGVKFDQDTKCLDAGCNRARITQTVLWRAPRKKGVEIRVYGVTECLAMPAHPEPGAGRVLPRRAHGPAGVGPPAARHGAGDSRPGALELETVDRLRRLGHILAPRWALVPRNRHRCLQRVGPLDLRHRRAR